ncbi:hypothetical protein ACGFZK_10530 [Streptomyces sp. NPDC048257]|uniref:hypothetical protein n=1 Tax=Streptomyces sp. NPDC048257 TaxID=3365526 RepID=UPI0037125C16
MLERKRRMDQTEVPLAGPTEAPPAALAAGAGRSFRYLAAGDYWFDGDSAGRHQEQGRGQSQGQGQYRAG